MGIKFKTMEKEQIKKLILKNDLTITDVIDAAIELNAIIGVGLVSLGSGLNEYCLSKITQTDTD